MNEIYVLTEKNQKYETKALYEEVFPEDKGPFSDWYYEDRCRDNIIISMKSHGEIIAMAHLNPFTVCNKDGQEAPIYYIYAVATKKTERHKGCMTAVLNKSFETMKEKHVPFCFLIPVSESIYTPFGFYTVSKFTPERILDFSEVTSNYDIYIKEDEDYQRRALKEDELCENMEEDLPENPVIMVKIISEKSFAIFSGLSDDATEKEMISWLKKQRIYISESV
ncbi:GNAT family N-acetyltransferase [Oribacterium sp. P6A1]|uniref:GNAT family N-acetyltransferase n=1 Tax=Oribacterium sp. P6A1 TaxID=1410612 RepID=UPI00068E0889|nr:GNAT family N-acetyltransferase [Oribacterium sp. P6A1]